MQSADGFLMWLFEETRACHTRADAAVEARTANMTTSSYRSFLTAMLGFDAPLEAALAYTRPISGLFELRHRAGFLVHDLLSLGMRPHEIAMLPQCSITPFTDAATAAGWLYVYERSRLQHPVLCTHIKAALPDVREATQYFCQDDIAVSRNWSSFVSRLEALADERNARAAIRDAALEAFAMQLAWLTAGEIKSGGLVSL